MLEEGSSQCILKIEKNFKASKHCRNCFLKGCKWSPDGTCLLVGSEDFHLRLFEINNDSVCGSDSEGNYYCLDYREGGTVYDYDWYPFMDSSNPTSCVFASSSRHSPVHLWDAFTGELRATYQPINQFDEVHSAISLCFSPDGTNLYCGFKREIKIFDVSIPGRESTNRSLKDEYQTGIISCIAVNPVMHSLYALGSYDKTIGLYTESNGDLQCLLNAHKGGLTQIMFSPDGLRLYSGGRQDSELYCWDLREPGNVLFTIQRNVTTCQRIQFDLSSDGKTLITGSTSGEVSVYDTSAAPMETGFLNKEYAWQAHMDCTNGLSIHPYSERVATASGQRHCKLSFSDDESDDSSSCEEYVENSLKVWKMPR